MSLSAIDGTSHDKHEPKLKGAGSGAGPGSATAGAQDAAPVDNDPSKQEQAIPEYAIMLLMIECMNLHQGNLVIQAEQLTGNANEQNYWENQIQQIHNTIPPAGAKKTTIAKDNAINEDRNNQRSNDEDMLVTMRQQAQVMMSTASTETNEVQQTTDVLSFVLKTRLSEGQVIIDMNGNNS